MKRAGTIATGALLVCGAGWLLWRGFPAAAPPVPMPDLDRAHPRVAEALREGAAEVRRRPRSADPWGDYGTLLFAHHFRAEASTCFEQAARLDPYEFRWPYFLGYIEETADLESAAAHYRAAVHLDPTYVPLRIRLARVLARQGRSEPAEDQLLAAAGIAPSDPHVLLELGRSALARADYQAARGYLERAASRGGWYPRPALVELARVSTILGDDQTALAARQAAARLPEAGSELPDPLLREAERRDVLSRDLARQADVLMASGEWDSAVRLFEELCRRRPDFPRPFLNLAICLQMRGDDPRAISILRELCTRFPGDASARLSLALALEQTGDNDQAIAAYREVLQIKPDSAAAHFNLGLILERQGRHEEACASYRAAVEADPTHAPAHLALGVLLQKSNVPHDDFLPHLRAAVRLTPGDPVPQRFLQQALAENKTPGRSLEADRGPEE